jgi:hypothetical protein
VGLRRIDPFEIQKTWGFPVDIKNQPIEVTQKTASRSTLRTFFMQVQTGHTEVAIKPDPGKKWTLLTAFVSANVGSEVAVYQGIREVFAYFTVSVGQAEQVDFRSNTVIVRASDTLELSAAVNSWAQVRVIEDNDT